MAGQGGRVSCILDQRVRGAFLIRSHGSRDSTKGWMKPDTQLGGSIPGKGTGLGFHC